MTGPPRTLTLSNHGQTPLQLRRTETTGTAAGDFAVVNDACRGSTIPVGGTCTLEVIFTPTEGAAGWRSSA